MDELASPRLRPRGSACAAASSRNARVDTAAASSNAASSASGATSAAAPPDNKRRRRCNPLGVSAYQEKHLPVTHTNFMLNETGWRADREELVRRHDLGRTASNASWESIDVEIDEDGEMHEMDADMDTETPRRKLGPGLSFARRGDIHLLFVNTFGSPPEDSWGGRDGVAALIRHRLDIPSDSYRMVFRALEDIAACEKANTVYDPSGDAAFSGRKALVSRFLSRGGGFCPPRVIARGQVVIRTPHWRNKRGAAYTSFVLLFFRWKFLPFAPRRRPKRADFFPRARPHGKQSRNTRAWPVHRPKQDPRVRTSKMDRPKATARPIRSACRLSQCGPISDNSDSGPI